MRIIYDFVHSKPVIPEKVKVKSCEVKIPRVFVCDTCDKYEFSQSKLKSHECKFTKIVTTSDNDLESSHTVMLPDESPNSFSEENYFSSTAVDELDTALDSPPHTLKILPESVVTCDIKSVTSSDNNHDLANSHNITKLNSDFSSPIPIVVENSSTTDNVTIIPTKIPLKISDNDTSHEVLMECNDTENNLDSDPLQAVDPLSIIHLKFPPNQSSQDDLVTSKKPPEKTKKIVVDVIPTKIPLRKIVQYVQLEDKDDIFSCDNCDSKFSSQSRLESHISKQHADPLYIGK